MDAAIWNRTGINAWKDERGGTIWGLLWFILLVGGCGMALDTTDGFRLRTMLQANLVRCSSLL